jgi:hypothetical protein
MSYPPSATSRVRLEYQPASARIRHSQSRRTGRKPDTVGHHHAAHGTASHLRARRQGEFSLVSAEGVVSSLRTLRTGCRKTIEDSQAGLCRDVESPPGDHCCHRGEAPGQRGGPQLRGRPVLDLHAAGPVPRRRRGGVRAAVPAAEILACRDQPGHHRADHQVSQRAVRAGPGRRPAHHRRPKATPGERTADSHDRLRHIGIGRAHARTHVILLIHDLYIRVINAATGELLRELTLDPTCDY